MNERILIAVGSDELAAIQAELVAIRAELRKVKMVSQPDWITASEYAERVGVTTRTIHNWIARGEVESRRHGKTVMIRVNLAT